MQHHTHGHVYRAAEVHRVIAEFGRQPPAHVKQQLRETLAQEKGRYQALDQMRARQQQQSRGRGR